MNACRQLCMKILLKKAINIKSNGREQQQGQKTAISYFVLKKFLFWSCSYKWLIWILNTV